MLYWNVGQRILRDVLGDERAAYGERIIATLSQQLTSEFGRGFTRSSLSRMMHFAEVFPSSEIVATLSQQLSWSHFVEIIKIPDGLKRDFYAEMCRLEHWSVRTLRNRIDGMLFERTALSRKPDELIHSELQALREEDKLSPDLVFRDPYLLDFLNLKDTYSEKDLENAILRELESFILELGIGFTFVERQKRISLDGDDYYLDLLFYHRKLRRLVAIELKLSDFKPADKGQMELYLKWLRRYEQQPGEDTPLGIILCAGKKEKTIELLELDQSGIHVAAYLTELPPKAVLEEKLAQAIESARARLDNKQELLDE